MHRKWISHPTRSLSPSISVVWPRSQNQNFCGSAKFKVVLGAVDSGLEHQAEDVECAIWFFGTNGKWGGVSVNSEKCCIVLIVLFLSDWDPQLSYQNMKPDGEGGHTTAQNWFEGAATLAVSASLTREPGTTCSGMTPAKLNNGVRVPFFNPNDVWKGTLGWVSNVCKIEWLVWNLGM